MYDSLYKLYYSSPKEHSAIYQQRFISPSSVHLPFKIREFNHDRFYTAFFCYNQDVTIALERIYSHFIDFMRILPKVPPMVLYQFALGCIVDEVHSTSDIEGIHSTHRELRDILDGDSNNVHFSSIIRQYEMLTSGIYPSFKTCEDVRRFYDEFAHEDAVANNPKNRLDGVLFRKEAVDVLSPSGKIIHRGVEPEEKVIEAMKEALTFLNSEDYPALIRIAVFHYLFVYIHPFYDGNGRTARFISSCYIAEHLHSLVALRLSVIIKRHKKEYYSMLRKTDAFINCGELTPFICGFLELVEETLYEINRKLERKIKQLERVKQKLFTSLPDDECIRSIMLCLLNASAFYGRGASMSDLMTASGKTRNTVKKKLLSMPVRVVEGKRYYYKINWLAVKRL